MFTCLILMNLYMFKWLKYEYILWSPLKIWTPKNFTTANFRHPVSESWLIPSWVQWWKIWASYSSRVSGRPYSIHVQFAHISIKHKHMLLKAQLPYKCNVMGITFMTWDENIQLFAWNWHFSVLFSKIYSALTALCHFWGFESPWDA